MRFLERVTAIHRRLDEAGIAHAFGGALAQNFYGEPRLTKDIDVNVAVPTAERTTVHRALATIGVLPNGEVDAERNGWEQYEWDGVVVDVFYADLPFHRAIHEAAVEQPWLDDELLPFLSAEHIVACKAIFDRPKDWPDIEQILFGMDAFDAAEALRHVADIAGTDSQRYQRLRRAIIDLRGDDGVS